MSLYLACLFKEQVGLQMEKLSNYESKGKHVNKDQEIKKLKERIEALEFIKDFQQDVIIEFEKVTGKELSKKYLPEHIANSTFNLFKKISLVPLRIPIIWASVKRIFFICLFLLG
jgi:hypothetical protein